MSRAFSLFLAGSLFLALLAISPSMAGTKAAPEVNDPTGDVTYAGTGTPVGGTIDDPGTVGPTTSVQSIDFQQAWIDGETGKALSFHVRTLKGFYPCQEPPAPATWTFTAQANGKTVTQAFGATNLDTSTSGVPPQVVFTCMKFAPVTPLVAQNVTLSDSNLQLDFVIPRSAFGNASAGTPVTFKWSSVGYTIATATAPVLAVSDVAPNGGDFSTTPFVFVMDTAGASSGGSSCVFKTGETNKTDSDRDCLPDYWEKQYFTNVTAQNATGDPDHDGCNNRCEYLAGTSPIVADTPCVFKAGETNKTDSDKDCLPDSWEMKYFGNVTKQNATGDPDKDGCDNRCEYLAGTDPTKSDLATTTPSSTGSSTGSKTSTGTSTSFGTENPAANPASSVLDKIKADAGYVIASSAAMGAVVLISLVGLFGRWGA